MNLAQWLPVISAAVGRDISPEVASFYRGRAAVGQSLNPEAQKFFAENWRKIVDFMETEQGREAIKQFIDSWLRSLMPVAEPESDPPPSRRTTRTKAE